MIPELTVTSEYLEHTKDSCQTWHRHQDHIRYFQEHPLEGRILDIGEKNPLTGRLERVLGVKIENTESGLDLDEDWFTARGGYRTYDRVLCIHVLEHLFSPLHVLKQIEYVLKDDGLLYVGLPHRPHFLRGWKNHFHEFDRHSLDLLVRRSGFQILRKDVFRVKRTWRFHLSGVRPALRFFLDQHAMYELTKTGKGHQPMIET